VHEADSKWSRIVSQPKKRGKHVIVNMCTYEGNIDEVIVTKKHGKDEYTGARKAKWGDRLKVPRLIERDAEQDAERKRQRTSRRWSVRRREERAETSD
tara:strand:- start:1148 stop:1441 length:294 start_codon:yes stop_codon:yes gene_type:complete